MKTTISNDPAGDPRVRLACNRADLAGWSERGGPLPRGLADHILRCPACAGQVRRLGQVHASLTMLRTRPVPIRLYSQASRRALRMLRRAARASEAARRLIHMRPDLTAWQKAQIHLARASVGAAAVLLLLVAQIGVLSGFEQTRNIGLQLASRHWDRHIDPDHEWLEPPNLA